MRRRPKKIPYRSKTVSRRLTALLAALTLLLPGCTSPVREASADLPLPAGDLKYVALTFDDGPRADTTAALLNGLRQRGASATFFLIGQQIPGNEDLIARMAAEGHQVGNHTYGHTRLQSARDNTIIEEIHKTEVLLTDTLGPGDYWLRPPYGLVDRGRSSLIHTPMIYWSLDPEDWKLLNADKVSAYVLERIQPGDIVLLHDFYPTSVEAALRIIDVLQKEGYAFVTVSELFDIYGTVPEAGKLYKNATQERNW